MRVIFIEGANGVGKSTTSNLLRESISYSTMIKMCGLPKRYDGVDNIYDYHDYFVDLIENLSKLQGSQGLTVICDRSSLSEVVYSEVYKDRDFREYCEKILGRLQSMENIDVQYILLRVTSVQELSLRLIREKASYADIEYSVGKSLQTQKKYEEVWEWLQSKGLRTKIYSDCEIGHIIKSIKEDGGFREDY